MLMSREVGEVYGRMCPSADSFEAANSDNWIARWYKVVSLLGTAVEITEDAAREYFEALGKPMPEPTW
jgi:hypothetical protein